MKLNNKGFSLVELMVVVAIIGILASVAVPSINKYMAKARQSEAKTNLGSLYTAEKAFAAEYTKFHTKFLAIGFAPEGRMRYNVGFTAAGNEAALVDGYTEPANVTASNAINSSLYCAAPGAAIVAPVTCGMLNGADSAAPPAPTTAGALTATAFVATSSAVLVAGTKDEWTIDNTKILTTVINGIL